METYTVLHYFMCYGFHVLQSVHYYYNLNDAINDYNEQKKYYKGCSIKLQLKYSKDGNVKTLYEMKSK